MDSNKRLKSASGAPISNPAANLLAYQPPAAPRYVIGRSSSLCGPVCRRRTWASGCLRRFAWGGRWCSAACHSSTRRRRRIPAWTRAGRHHAAAAPRLDHAARKRRLSDHPHCFARRTTTPSHPQHHQPRPAPLPPCLLPGALPGPPPPPRRGTQQARTPALTDSPAPVPPGRRRA